MPDFRGYLCWDSATASGAVSTEAVVPSQAVFAATHTPLRIRKARIRGRSLELMSGEADENTVLSDFMGRQSDTGNLLMPVVGDTGTGKSHLVRWVRTRIPESDHYRIIYLEKSQTSLKAVMETLIAEAESPALAKLKNDIESFSAGLDAAALARRIINALNESLAQTTPQEMSGQSRALAGTRGLASILQDPYTQEHMLSEGMFIPLLASQLLNDRKDPDSKERPPGFTVDDLPLQIDPRQTAEISRRLLGHLVVNPILKTTAVDLLNQHLEAAIRSAYQLGAGRLSAAMLQVREEFARKGREIILLIEDFALIQGVQRELLDAITEPAIRESKEKYAPIRALMAVTTGYFTDLPETVMSRVAAATTGYVYDLDVPFGQDDDGTEEIASFAGRYLNAARIGREELDRLGVGNVPNRCEACGFSAECHEAFGYSAEGYGLYPFNRSALARTVHSVNSLGASAREWAFVPRNVLGSVIRPILIEDSAALSEGNFPADGFRERFRGAPIDRPLSNTVAETINEYDKSTPEQRKLILEFWADAPDDANQVNPGILKAFGLRALPEEAGSRDRTDDDLRWTRKAVSDDSGSEVRKPPGSALRNSLTRKIHNIEEWGARPQGEIGTDVARELRTILTEAVIRGYTFRSPLMQEQTKGLMEKAFPNNSSVVSIVDSGQRLSGADSAPMQFLRTPRNALFFQSLLRAKDDVTSARAEDIRRLAHLAEVGATALTGALQRHLGITDEELTVALRASLIGAALAGRAWPGAAETDLLCAAFDDGRTWLRGDLAELSRPWQDALQSHLRSRPGLVGRLRDGVGISQGGGAVQLVDATRVLPLLRDAMAGWTWSTETQIPDWVKSAVNGFSRWPSMIDEQFGRLGVTVARIRQLLPGGASGSEAAEDVKRVLQDSAKVGIAPSRDDDLRFQALLARVQRANWRVIPEIENDLGKARAADSPGSQWKAKVTAVARDREESLGAIRDFLNASDQLLGEALDKAGARRDPAGDDAAKQVADLVQEWGDLLGQEEEDE
jgi:hypothetical protein